MANLLPNSFFSDDEWEEMLNRVRNFPPLTKSIIEHEPSEVYIPFESDENGIYGYKVLVYTRDSHEYFSPSPFIPFHYRLWRNGEIQAHDLPTESALESPGIYGTKDLAHLEEWIEEYTNHYYRSFAPIDSFFSKHSFYLVVARVYVWGQIVETEYGFRAQFARIKEIIHEYR